jgi:hypothetical protein
VARSDDDKKEPPKIPSADERPRDSGRHDAADHLREKAQQRLQRDTADIRLRDDQFQRWQGKAPEDPVADRLRESLLDRKRDILRAEPGWRPDLWDKLKEAARWAALERTEHAFAAIEGRNPVPIRILPRVSGEKALRPDAEAHGALITIGGAPTIMYIDRTVVQSPYSAQDVLKLYVHEEHHIEQITAVMKPESRPDFSVVLKREWKASFEYEAFMHAHELPISFNEYLALAHEVSARTEELRLYMRYL